MDPESRVNSMNTFEELFALGVIPVVNENDSVETYEIRFGDNDRLSAIVTALIHADLLILLSDIDGLYTDDPKKNPKAEFIPEVDVMDDHFRKMGKDSTGSDFGTGGMATKITAAMIATAVGADMVILNGENIGILSDLFQGKDVGTIFHAHPEHPFKLENYLKEVHQ